MHTLYIGNRKIDFPSCWEEVSGEQLVQLAAILHGQMTKQEAMARLLMVLMNMRQQPIITRILWVFAVGSDAKYDCLRGVQWVLTEENLVTKNRMPVISLPPARWWGKSLKLYGPLDECKKLVFLEFIEADMAYLDFRRSFEDEGKRNQALNRLVAVLYRTKNADMPRRKYAGTKWNGDPRAPYNSDILDYVQAEMDRLPMGVKYAVLMFYHACHMRWEGMFQHIFKKADAQSVEGGGSSGGNWAGALKSLAGGSLNVEQMSKANALFALMDLDDRIRESEEMAAKLEKKGY